jgi:thymidylate kinase
MSTNRRPLIVSFSGIDGAGKSTQISSLTTFLESLGLRTKLITFWDDVVVLSRYREYMSLKAFGGDAGIGTPDAPVNRRDKNVTSWPVTVLRFFLYLADSVRLRLLTHGIDRAKTDAIIFDRYIYDELANLPLNWTFTRIFIPMLLRIVPRPDAAFLIDANPTEARARKPEYPLEFLLANREAYLGLSRLTRHLTVVGPSSIEEAAVKVQKTTLESIQGPDAKLSTVPAVE